jgi:hypothetical protein
MPATITRWAAPLANRAAATWHRQVVGAVLVREFGRREPADHDLGQLPRLEAVEVGTGIGDQPQPDLIDRDLPIKQPLLRPRIRDGLGQQVVHLHDLDAAIAHLAHKVEMVPLGFLDPENVVEQ